MPESKWEKKFDKIFGVKVLEDVEFFGDPCDQPLHIPLASDVKDFIRSVETEAKEEVYKYCSKKTEEITKRLRAINKSFRKVI